LLGDGDKEIEIVYGKEKNILYCADYAKTEQTFLVPALQAQKPTKEGHLSFVHFEFPFTSVSTVSRVHPFLVSQILQNRLITCV
jgi:hypothetical protein